MSEWISVDDKFPLQGQEVLIFCLDKGRRIGFLDNGDWCFNGKYYDARFITHWQPLPSPPESQ